MKTLYSFKLLNSYKWGLKNVKNVTENRHSMFGYFDNGQDTKAVTPYRENYKRNGLKRYATVCRMVGPVLNNRVTKSN